jgi:hypothetical protein
MIFVSSVARLVEFQSSSQGKSLVANITHMISTCVGQLVFSKISSKRESLAANFTHVIFLTCVNQSVTLQSI